MWREFKEFINRGNVMDLAVGVIIAFVIFLLVKAYNQVRKDPPKEAPKPVPTPTESLLAEIRDLLKVRA